MCNLSNPRGTKRCLQCDVHLLSLNLRKKFVARLCRVISYGPNEFKKVVKDEIAMYVRHARIDPGIARNEALKENIFATAVCFATRTPMILIGPPGSSKTLGVNIVVQNMSGDERTAFYRHFPKVDMFLYLASEHSTAVEVEQHFAKAVERQKYYLEAKVDATCAVVLDEAGLPKEKRQVLKSLHYYLDGEEVAFVAITNHALDAANSNRGVNVYRSLPSLRSLQTLALGCLCDDPEHPPDDIRTYTWHINQFCRAYHELNADVTLEFGKMFGLRDFIHFVRYFKRQSADHKTFMFSPEILMRALERNFNGVPIDSFRRICEQFFSKLDTRPTRQPRDMLAILRESLADRCPQGSNLNDYAVRPKLLIDSSKDDSLSRLLFQEGILNPADTSVIYFRFGYYYHYHYHYHYYYY
jgi:hypothetical protein